MITPDHFLVRPYFIPSIEEESEDIQDFIDLWEKKFLLDLLGSVFYDALVAGLEVPTPDAKWTELRDGGVTYEYNDYTYKWEGLIELLKPAIYSEWLKGNHERVSASGVTRHLKDKTEYINPGRLIAKAQNEFARRTGDEGTHEDTMYGYVYSRYTDYVTSLEIWRFKAPKFVNVFGI